ncbi:hypothetical protein ACFP2T_31455 [Plantactinospora solaniradicis]|uniref:SH3 domain-containing protein n=1 Tax=Plantactinospora solaniradicis TaxID=1723736 RepID=A0ABW1KHJ1_9ACTN
MTRLPARTLASAASAFALAAATITIASPASAHWSCGRAAPDDITTSWGSTTASTSARVGSSARCATAHTISPNENLDYHCFAVDINGIETWTYVVSVPNPSKRGWVSDSMLNDGGSYTACPNQG